MVCLQYGKRFMGHHLTIALHVVKSHAHTTLSPSQQFYIRFRLVLNAECQEPIITIDEIQSIDWKLTVQLVLETNNKYPISNFQIESMYFGRLRVDGKTMLTCVRCCRWTATQKLHNCLIYCFLNCLLIFFSFIFVVLVDSGTVRMVDGSKFGMFHI